MTTNHESTQLEPTDIGSLLTDLVKALVRNPEEVRVDQKVLQNLAVFHIATAQEDVRLLLGKTGAHLNAIKTLVDEICSIEEIESSVSIQDSPDLKRAFKGKYPHPTGEIDVEKADGIRTLLERVLLALDCSAERITLEVFGTQVILEAFVDPESYAILNDRKQTFVYGRDGLLIGSIKTLLDGISKAQGAPVRIALAMTEDGR